MNDWLFKAAWERHRPPHRVARGDALFITASTCERTPHLRSPERKGCLLELLLDRCREFDVGLVAWVLLDEHYHLVIDRRDQEVFTAWIRSLHSISSGRLNREDGCRGRQVWHQYWDVSLWTNGDVWSRINYIHNNPVKHGYVSDSGEWPWSSLQSFAEAWEEPASKELLLRFPAPRKVPHDDF